MQSLVFEPVLFSSLKVCHRHENKSYFNLYRQFPTFAHNNYHLYGCIRGVSSTVLVFQRSQTFQSIYPMHKLTAPLEAIADPDACCSINWADPPGPVKGLPRMFTLTLKSPCNKLHSSRLRCRGEPLYHMLPDSGQAGYHEMLDELLYQSMLLQKLLCMLDECHKTIIAGHRIHFFWVQQ